MSPPSCRRGLQGETAVVAAVATEGESVRCRDGATGRSARSRDDRVARFADEVDALGLDDIAGLFNSPRLAKTLPMMRATVVVPGPVTAAQTLLRAQRGQRQTAPPASASSTSTASTSSSSPRAPSPSRYGSSTRTSPTSPPAIPSASTRSSPVRRRSPTARPRRPPSLRRKSPRAARITSSSTPATWKVTSTPACAARAPTRRNRSLTGKRALGTMCGSTQIPFSSRSDRACCEVDLGRR